MSACTRAEIKRGREGDNGLWLRLGLTEFLFFSQPFFFSRDSFSHFFLQSKEKLFSFLLPLTVQQSDWEKLHGWEEKKLKVAVFFPSLSLRVIEWITNLLKLNSANLRGQKERREKDELSVSRSSHTFADKGVPSVNSRKKYTIVLSPIGQTSIYCSNLR